MKLNIPTAFAKQICENRYLVDVREEERTINSLFEETISAVEGDGDAVLEPHVGMEFDSEDAARNFYVEYARKAGFVVRVMQRRRSDIDGRTLARKLGCNKQGYSPSYRNTNGSDKKSRPSAREGCNAAILFKLEKSGKWAVTKFEKEHNHPLAVPSNELTTEGDKDKKIERLTKELEHQEQLATLYREKIFSFINEVEELNEDLSTKIQRIVDIVRRAETETRNLSLCR